MKTKTTRTQISSMYSTVYQCGYCDLQLLYREEARFYTCGIYGWNYDVYVFRGTTAITSGYRGMFGMALPEECKRILQNAEKHLGNAQGTFDSRERYRKLARRAFEKALMSDAK